LALIELQGKILLDDDDGGATPGLSSALSLGRFVFPSTNDVTTSHCLEDWDGRRVFLLVGKHQRLAGEVKKLPKPLAVTRRRREAEPSPSAALGGQQQPGAVASSASEDLEIVGIVTQKIMFAHRPEPIGVDQESEAESEKV
jgi:chromosome transmission fidelity protein 8